MWGVYPKATVAPMTVAEEKIYENDSYFQRPFQNELHTFFAVATVAFGIMNLINLPEEIIRIIIKDLDIKSIKSLYETCRYLRGIILMPGSVKKCKISKSNLATARFLKTKFFKDISPFIQDLDVSTVQNLCQTSFLAAVKKLRALKSLNVSYTPLKLEHLADITVTCPDLKNICANFAFAKQTPENTLLRIQNFLKKLENVHFVVPVECISHSILPFFVLENSKFKSLTFTLLPISSDLRIRHISDDSPHKIPDFQQLNIYYLGLWNSEAHYLRLNDLPILRMLDINLFEFIVICFSRYNMAKLFISEQFVNFFSKYSNLDISCIDNLNACNRSGNLAIMLWKKNATKFDDVFFDNLSNNIKQIIFCRIQGDEMTLPNTFDKFIMEPIFTRDDSDDEASNELKIKRRRIGLKEKVLDYDQLFRNNGKIGLCFEFNSTCLITLLPSSNYLSKITFFSLFGSFKVTPNFFNVLFQCCTSLKTLDLKIHFMSLNFSFNCTSLSLSSSLRNFRLVTKEIKFNDVLLGLSQCKTIENISIKEICISDGIKKDKEHIDPSLLFKNCKNLYSLQLDFPTSETYYKNQLRPLFSKALAKYNKRNLNLVLCPSFINQYERNYCNYNLFLEEFRLNTISRI